MEKINSEIEKYNATNEQNLSEMLTSVNDCLTGGLYIEGTQLIILSVYRDSVFYLIRFRFRITDFQILFICSH